jgi:hypothetical protein
MLEKAEDQVTYNNLPTAFLKIRKNTQDDSLRILETVKQFISDEPSANSNATIDNILMLIPHCTNKKALAKKETGNPITTQNA